MGAPLFLSVQRDAIDLCDVLSRFSSQAKATLHEICRVMGLPGKGADEGAALADARYPLA